MEGTVPSRAQADTPRTPPIMSAHDMEPTIAYLITQLQHPVDLFEDRRLCDEIAKRGADATRELLNFLPQNPVLSERLLRTILDGLHDESARNRVRNDLEARIEPNNHPTVRRVCMRLTALYFQNASHIGARLLDFANTGADETRIDAIVPICRTH
jgi:hypothetical protein